MNFAQPWFFLLYIPYALLAVLAFRYRRPSLRIPSVKPFRKSGAAGKKFFLNYVPILIPLLALALLILAMSRPRRGIEELRQKVEGIDIMLVLDISGSMKAIDIPDSYRTREQLEKALREGDIKTRIEVAREEIRKFVEKRPNDRIGLLVFAPLPYLACPPTLDHPWLLENLDKMKPGDIGDATALASPIATATHRLKDSESKRRIVVLFTDGKNNVTDSITPLQAAKIAKTFDVTVYTVGIGSKNAFMLRETPFGRMLDPFAQEFDSGVLKKIAEIGEGRYYAARDAKSLEESMEEIDRLEKTSLDAPVYMEYREFAWPLVLASLFLLFTAFVLEHSIFLKIP